MDVLFSSNLYSNYFKISSIVIVKIQWHRRNIIFFPIGEMKNSLHSFGHNLIKYMNQLRRQFTKESTKIRIYHFKNTNI